MKVEWVPLAEILEHVDSDCAVDPAKSYAMLGVRSFGRGAFDAGVLEGGSTAYGRLRQVISGQVVYPKLMAWEGAFAVVPQRLDRRWVSPEFVRFRVREDIASVPFVEHLLSWSGFSDMVKNSSPGTNVRRRRLNPRDFLGIVVPLPRKLHQERIAAHLAAVATYREQGPKVVDLRATLPRILGDLLRVQELPNVPLSELCGNRQTVIHPGDSLQGADRFVGLEHIESHTGQSTGGRPIGTESGRKLLFEPGNVTYGYLRPYLNKAWVADITGLCSVEQFVLVPGNGVDPNLLSVVLRSDIVLQAAKEATNSLQLPRLSLRVLLGIEVPDIRRLDNAPEVLREASSLTRSVIRLAELTSKRRQLAESLLPAARNEIFNAMR